MRIERERAGDSVGVRGDPRQTKLFLEDEFLQSSVNVGIDIFQGKTTESATGGDGSDVANSPRYGKAAFVDDNEKRRSDLTDSYTDFVGNNGGHAVHSEIHDFDEHAVLGAQADGVARDDGSPEGTSEVMFIDPFGKRKDRRSQARDIPV